MHCLIPALIVVLQGAVCAQVDADAKAKAKAKPPKPTVIVASNELGWDLYRELSNGGGNLFFSPYSISLALGMTRMGAAGRTAEQMDEVLHTTGLNVASGHRALIAALLPPKVRDFTSKRRKRVPAYELSIANALWGQFDFDFEDRFLGVLDEKFGAPFRTVDFADSIRARGIINKWVEERTNRKIRNLIPSGLPRPGTKLVIGNAMYFKAPWAEQFKPRATRAASFTLLDGKTMKVPMMHLQKQYALTTTDDEQVIEIPYRGRSMSMFVVLPKAKNGLAAVEARLSPSLVNYWQRRLHRAQVQLELPRFEFTSSVNLGTVLSRMGMRDAFSVKRADFSAMSTERRLFVGAVLHKAFITVDETGSEAAAATAVLMMPTGAIRGEKPVPFIVDHPFRFFIQHQKTKCVLFAGRVTRPTARGRGR